MHRNVTMKPVIFIKLILVKMKNKVLIAAFNLQTHIFSLKGIPKTRHKENCRSAKVQMFSFCESTVSPPLCVLPSCLPGGSMMLLNQALCSKAYNENKSTTNKQTNKLSVTIPFPHLSTQETDTGGSLWVPSQPESL
jgi:hypothetical protein